MSKVAIYVRSHVPILLYFPGIHLPDMAPNSLSRLTKSLYDNIYVTYIYDKYD